MVAIPGPPGLVASGPFPSSPLIPSYAFAILNSYVRLKLYRGKTPQEVHDKLQTIEVQVRRPPPFAVLTTQLPPKFGATCIEIRKVHHLPPSRVFHLVPREEAPAREFHRLGPNGTPIGSNGVPVGRSTSTSRPTPVPIVSNSTPPAPPRVRDPEAGEELPPPPYAAEDPEPEATRLLQERLGSEVVTSELGIAPQHRRTPSTSSSMIGGDAPRPAEFPASPAARAGSIHSSIHQPQSQEEQSDEERRAREESELEEALRESRAAEEERLQYEAAVQASIASAEEDSLRRSTRGGDSSGAGPSSQPTQTFTAHSNPTVPEMSPALRAAQQDLLSSKGDAPSRPPYVSIPGAYDTKVPIPSTEYHSFNYHPPASSSTHNNESDLDILGDLDFNDNTLPEPLQPVPTGISNHSTGTSKSHHLQSRNPFLSVEEREAQQEIEEAEAAVAENASPGQPTLSQSLERELPPLPPLPPREPQGGYQGLEPPPLPSREPQSSYQTLEPPSLASLGLEPQAIPTVGIVPPTRANTVNSASALGSSPPASTNLGSSPPSSFAGWKHSPMPPSTTTVERRASRPLPKPVGSPYQGPAVLPPGHANWQPNRPSSRSSRLSSDQYSQHGGLNSPSTASPYVTPPVSPPATSGWQTQPSSLAPAPPSRARSPGPILDESGEDALEMLRDYDTVFLIDDSSSMAGERWQQAQAALRGVVSQAMKHVDSGVDIYFLNAKRVGRGLQDRSDVEELFAGLEPRGATPTALRMESILRDYMARLEACTDDSVPAMNLIVVTDGGGSFFPVQTTN